MALESDVRERGEWHSLLVTLAEEAAEGWWNVQGRLLYDLQKVCVNFEREIYSVSVVEWLLEGCRRPLRRPQPNQRLVLMRKALQSAADRVSLARLSPIHRTQLAKLIDSASHRVETRLRAHSGRKLPTRLKKPALNRKRAGAGSREQTD